MMAVLTIPKKKVKWFETPQYFDKDELPCVISKKLGQRQKWYNGYN